MVVGGGWGKDVGECGEKPEVSMSLFMSKEKDRDRVEKTVTVWRAMLKGDASVGTVADVGAGDVGEEMLCVFVKVEMVVEVFMCDGHEFVPCRGVGEHG